MLSKILSKDFCASCGFCCIFKAKHLWETPKFSEKDMAEIKADPHFKEIPFRKITLNNADVYTFVMAEEEMKPADSDVKCPFLDLNAGCALNHNKPFECFIWPYRIMIYEGKRVLAVSRLCPGIQKYTQDFLADFAKENLVDKILSYLPDHEHIIKPYTDSYNVLFAI